MAKNRRPISLSLRFSVYARDDHTCQYCGRKPPDVELQLDHVYPVSLGGRDKIDNLLTACRDCNIGKGARDPGLAMPSRPLTPREENASRQWWARWWTQDAAWTRDPRIQSIAWEIAAKGANDPVILRRFSDDDLLVGFVAIGVLRVRFQSATLSSVSIERYRGKKVDDISREQGFPAPWGLAAAGDIHHAPRVAEVY